MPQESEESIVREIISDGNGSHEEEDQQAKYSSLIEGRRRPITGTTHLPSTDGLHILKATAKIHLGFFVSEFSSHLTQFFFSRKEVERKVRVKSILKFFCWGVSYNGDSCTLHIICKCGKSFHFTIPIGAYCKENKRIFFLLVVYVKKKIQRSQIKWNLENQQKHVFKV